MVSEFDLFKTLGSVLNLEPEVELGCGKLISHKGSHYTLEFSVIRTHERIEELGLLFHFSMVTNSMVMIDFDAQLSDLKTDILSIGQERIIQFRFGSYFLRLCTINGDVTFIHMSGIADYKWHFNSEDFSSDKATRKQSPNI